MFWKMMNNMKIYIGADHRGFQLKEKLAKFLFESGYQFTDMGATFFNHEDDYTLYSSEVASLVAKEKEAMGIILCGSGVGADVTANKFDGVRASIGKNEEQVKAGRKDDDMNVLVIAADYTSDEEAQKLVKAFLRTKFDNAKRHKKRLDDIQKIEANN